MMAIAKFNKTNVHLLFRAALKIIKQQRRGGVSTVDVTKNVAEFVENLRCLGGFPTDFQPKPPLDPSEQAIGGV